MTDKLGDEVLTKFREPWFLSNDNDSEEWLITDGVETFPIPAASEAEFGLAVKGTIERAMAAVRAEVIEEAAKVADNARPEMGSHINVSQYRTGKHDAATLIAVAIRALTTPTEGN